MYIVVANISLAQVGVLYHTIHDGRTDPWYMHDTALVIPRTGAAIKARKLCAARKPQNGGRKKRIQNKLTYKSYRLYC